MAFDGAGLSPAAQYQQRLEARRATSARLDRLDARVAIARLLAFAVFATIAVLVWRARWPAAWLAVPLGGFVALVIAHARVRRARDHALRAARLYELGLARLEDRAPEGDGRSARFAEPNHPYAADVDLFGPRSLFERLSTARTSIGEETLAAWLSAPAIPSAIRERQQAVAELAPRLDLREDLAVVGARLDAEVNPRALSAWASAPPAPLPEALRALSLAGVRAVTTGLGICIAAAVIGALAFGTGYVPAIVAALAGAGWVRALRALVAPMLADADHRAAELKLVAVLLARLERESFAAPLLKRLRQELETSEGHERRAVPPSRRVAELARLVDLLDARRNQMAALLLAPLLWTTQMALGVEAWRRKHGAAVARWLVAVGEAEALVSLATFAFEHPELPFPTVLDDGAPPRFAGEALCHPLLPARTRIANDVALGAPDARVLIVSGSNMSGKSTLLRTVGANAVLALAGAPVCARRLTLSRLALGATLSIHDSLQEGRSRFYAEITRLRQIVELASGPVPVLFLVDELLSGTNSHDRGVGAQAIVRALLARGAIGLATTHDLALTGMATELGARADNVHFADELRDGQMVFDYQMHPGVVRKSNALALMRAIGLDVADEPDGARP